MDGSGPAKEEQREFAVGVDLTRVFTASASREINPVTQALLYLVLIISLSVSCMCQTLVPACV